MKLTLKQKIKMIEEWLDLLREDERINTVEKDNLLTIPIGSSKVFLDKENKNNDKMLIDYIVIKRTELSMLDSRIVESIFKLSQKSS
ncbi:MAG TPA: hypothetical protein VD908_20255 [Cytophagales bacterium]|nr:hypothetical protein [Cytophagales bacterium]